MSANQKKTPKQIIEFEICSSSRVLAFFAVYLELFGLNWSPENRRQSGPPLC